MKVAFIVISLLILLTTGIVLVSCTISASYIDQTTLRYKNEFQTFGIPWRVNIKDSYFTEWALRVKDPGPEKWYFRGAQALIGRRFSCGFPPAFEQLAGMLFIMEEHDPEIANTLFKQLIDPQTKVDRDFALQIEQAFERSQSNF